MKFYFITTVTYSAFAYILLLSKPDLAMMDIFLGRPCINCWDKYKKFIYHTPIFPLLLFTVVAIQSCDI